MKAFVLAAGEGLRLRPLTLERPKALLPILDRPQLAWVMSALVKAGIDEIVINAHHHAHAIAKESQRLGLQLGVRVALSVEFEQPLGTAGALRFASAQLRERFVLINSDLATDVPIADIIAAHESADAAATLLAVRSESQADLIVDDSEVSALVDRREQMRPGMVYGGIGVFEPEVIELIPEGPNGLYETVFVPLVKEERVAAFEWDGYWLDTGSPINYQRANLDALSGARRHLPPVVEEPLVSDGSRYIGAHAEVSDVSIRESVVGSRAKIAPGSRLERCIVWDNARVPRGEYRDEVITESRIVGVIQ